MCQNNEEFLFQVFCCTENTIEPLFFAQSKKFLTKSAPKQFWKKKKGWVISFNKQSEALAVNKNNYLFWIKSSRPSCESGVQKHKQSSQSPDNIDFHPA